MAERMPAASSRWQWLLRLYPRAWRDRCGGEVTALLEQAPMTVPSFRCPPASATRADMWKSNAALFAGTTVIALFYIFARVRFPAVKPHLEVLVTAILVAAVAVANRL